MLIYNSERSLNEDNHDEVTEEEELFKYHMGFIKEDANILAEEGKLINELQSI